MIRWAFWVLLATTTSIYLTMVLWSLPLLSTAADGLAMFDMRPRGYTPDQARDIIRALGPDGRAFYLGVQHRLDTVYPLLMAIVLSFSYYWAFPRFLALGLSLLAVISAGFDYLENAAVKVMLVAGPDGIGDAMALTASRWTVLKSSAVSVALTALFIGLLLVGWRWVRRIRANI